MAKKESKKVIPTRGAKNDKIKTEVKNGQPQQQKLTEEQAFAQYANQVITNTVLDLEGSKQRAVENVKALVQQLAVYIRENSKLVEENKKLQDQLKKKK